MRQECNNLLFDDATLDIIVAVAAIVITAGDQTLLCFIANKRGILFVVFIVLVVVFHAMVVHCVSSGAGTADAALIVVAVAVVVVLKYMATVY